MTAKRWLTAYGASLLAFVALDFVWLSRTAGFYREALAPILLDRPNLGPALLFYPGYVAGVVLFVVAPALERGGWRVAAVKGGLFGLVAYGTYDLTNLATLKGFSNALAGIDLAWGFTVTALSSVAGCLAARAIRQM